MTPEDTGKLLATCASFDRRTVGDLDVIAWHRVLGDLAYAECESAVIAHYTESREWVMPADVRTRVKRARRDTESRHRIRDLLNPATYRRQVEAADARTLAQIEARAGRTLAITGPAPVQREHTPAPAGRVLADPQKEALRQAEESRRRRGAEVSP